MYSPNMLYVPSKGEPLSIVFLQLDRCSPSPFYASEASSGSAFQPKKLLVVTTTGAGASQYIYIYTGMSMVLSNWIVTQLGRWFITYFRDLQPTSIISRLDTSLK